MKKISDLLEKFAKLARASDEAKNTVAAVLENNGVRTKGIKDISIKGTTVMLKLTAIQKSEVFLKQKKILQDLSQNPLTKHITAVR